MGDAYRIVPTDSDALIAGYHDCLDTVARERRWFGIVEALPLPATAAFVRKILAEGGVHLVAVDEEERVVGFCDIARHEREGFRHGGRIAVGLLAEARGRGLGGRLMTAALERARALGFERVELEVYASNAPAIALYRRLGFVDEGIKRRARKLDGRYDDDLLMAILFPVAE